MNFKHWNNFYKQLKTELPLNFDKDEEAAEILNRLLKDKKKISEDKLKNLIKDKEIIIFGAGPSLEKSILKHKDFLQNRILFSVDGATSALKKNNIFPDVIVSDLDGKIEDQIKYNEEESIVIVHAHGDNIDKLNRYVKEFKGPLFGTTQIDPKDFDNLYNYGGFTDGDRAVFIADHFKAKKIFLIGFDFNDDVGSYSFTKNKNLKIKKLKWCEKLINQISNDHILFLK